MKGRAIIMVLAVGLFVAQAGTVWAGSMGHGGKSEAMSSRSATPNPGSYEYSEALETGALSGSPSENVTIGHFRGEPVPRAEAGGLWYRAGIDTF